MTISPPSGFSPSFMSDPSLVALYGKAEREMGQLAGLLSTFEDPLIFHPLFARLEGVAMAALAGHQTSLPLLLMAEHSPGLVDASLTPAFRNVDTFLAMIEALDRDLPIDITYLIDLYQARSGKEGLEADKVFRQPGHRSTGVTLLPHRPPSPAKLGPGLFALEKFLKKKAPYPGLVIAALAFYQLHYLSPFVRFNGELSGDILAALLFRDGGAPFPFFALSRSITREYDQFQSSFAQFRDENDPTAWVIFMLGGMISHATHIDRLIRSLLQVQEEFMGDLLSEFGPVGSEGVMKLASELVTDPVLTVGGGAQSLRVTFRSAQLAIDKLVDVGVVVEMTGRKRNRLYMARRVVSVLEAELASV